MSPDPPRAHPLTIAIAGPTGAGKSAVAYHLAERLQGEVVSCDSMQLYAGIAVLTQQPPVAWLERVPHHFIGTVAPTESYNAARFQREATPCIEAIHRRGHAALIVGGTGLYLRALVDGLFPGPGADPELRQTLEERARREGAAQLHVALEAVDPVAASEIHPHNVRRVIRALEVHALTGQPISQLRRRREGLASKLPISSWGLTRPRAELDARINQRVHDMLEAGVLEELRRLDRGSLSLTARQVLGLRELGGHLDGAWSLEEAVAALQQQTRRYARRQLSWFRPDERIRWYEIPSEEPPVVTAEHVLAWLKEGAVEQRTAQSVVP